MKKILSIALIILILLSLFGCKTKKPDEQEPYIPAVESDGVDEKTENIGDSTIDDNSTESIADESIDIGNSIETDNSKADNNTEENTEIDEIADNVEQNQVSNDEEPKRETSSDIATANYSSIDELKTSIKEKTYTYMSLFEHNKVGTIEYFYTPVGFEGYELDNISVMPSFIYYRYVPVDKPYQSADEITAYYMRPEEIPEEYTGLEFYQEHQNGVINDDGLIYEPRYNRILFAAGESCITLYIPDSMNDYETLKPLCVAEKITVE